MRRIILAAALMLSASAHAIDPPAPYLNAIPSQRPGIEPQGVYKPQIQGSQSYGALDKSRVCGNTSLSAGDRAGCERDMGLSATDAARAGVRQKYEAKVTAPPPPITQERPSAGPVDEAVVEKAQVARDDRKESTQKQKQPIAKKQPDANAQPSDKPAY